MKHIKIFETYSTTNPTEKEIYEAADEYFISINPNIMDQLEYNRYGNYASHQRNNTNFKSSYLQLTDITTKSAEQVYGELFTFLKGKGYDIDAYCPILTDKERKGLDVADKVNFRLPSYREGEYGRAILVNSESGRKVCFYFSPGNNKIWWPMSLIIKVLDDESDVIYWTPTTKDDKLTILFWDGEKMVHGDFEISYDGYDENSHYAWEDATCSRASDSRSYTTTIKVPKDDIDAEDVGSIHRN